MPELPDILLYVSAFRRLIVGKQLRGLRVVSPFLLRTVHPPLDSFVGLTVRSAENLAKQLVWHFDDGRFLLFHLMVAGRFHKKKRGTGISPKTGHAAFDFEDFSLFLTEASTKKRAALFAGEDPTHLRTYDRGGLDVMAATEQEFTWKLLAERHTLKRALTDPRLFSGIGNAYSDEILHRAALSPLQATTNLDDTERSRLYGAARAVLTEWADRLIRETGDAFPEKVTAFRPEMSVHGKFRAPCPVCQTPVQRIVYAENECNYCPRCQTGGKILSDRSLARLLKEDWPKSVEDLDEMGRPPYRM